MASNLYLSQIERGALARGLDPAAVAAVASAEGGFGGPRSAPGDQGTSFGPFQLHIGGALPAQYASNPTLAQQWAWSPAGINYALDQIARVARGLGGQAAVTSIVEQFEHPSNPQAEIQRALGSYQQFQAGSSIPREPGSAADIFSGGTGAGRAIGSAVGSALNPLSSVVDFLNFVTSWRFAEVIGGFLLLVIGLILLGRQFGVSYSGPGVGAAGYVARAGA